MIRPEAAAPATDGSWLITSTIATAFTAVPDVRPNPKNRRIIEFAFLGLDRSRKRARSLAESRIRGRGI